MASARASLKMRPVTVTCAWALLSMECEMRNGAGVWAMAVVANSVAAERATAGSHRGRRGRDQVIAYHHSTRRITEVYSRRAIRAPRPARKDRKSTRLNSVTLPYLVCRLLL